MSQPAAAQLHHDDGEVNSKFDANLARAIQLDMLRALWNVGTSILPKPAALR